jgi:hypothetical protein
MPGGSNPANPILFPVVIDVKRRLEFLGDVAAAGLESRLSAERSRNRRKAGLQTKLLK